MGGEDLELQRRRCGRDWGRLRHWLAALMLSLQLTRREQRPLQQAAACARCSKMRPLVLVVVLVV